MATDAKGEEGGTQDAAQAAGGMPVPGADRGAALPKVRTARIPGVTRSPDTEAAGASLQATSEDEVIARIRLDAQSLTQQEQQQLHSHEIGNAIADLNEETYASSEVFRELLITFQNLRADSKAFLNIRPDQRAIFSEGDESNRLVGLSLSTSTDPVIGVRNFLVNAREMFLQTYQDCDEIKVLLYVRTDQSHVKGRIDLPPGAAVTLQSRNDRTTIIGLSSFAIDLA